MSPEQLRELAFRRLKQPGQEFHSILGRDGVVIAPGASYAKQAKVFRLIRDQAIAATGRCQYNSVYFSGFGRSDEIMGLPDQGFHTLPEVIDTLKWVVRAAYPLPVIADAETMFGGGVRIPYVVEAYNDIKVAVIHAEDQPFETRRCGNAAGKDVIPAVAFANTLKSTLEACEALESDMLVMARTDAINARNGGVEDAIERGKRYSDVNSQGRRIGLLWAESSNPDTDPLKRWCDAMIEHDPTMILALNYSPNKNWPKWYRKNRNGALPPTYEDFRKMGYRFIFHTIYGDRAATEGVERAAADLAVNGAKALWDLQDRQEGMLCGNPQKLSGLEEWQEYDKDQTGDVERYEKSGGYQKDKAF